jgi:hypothetical protein
MVDNMYDCNREIWCSIKAISNNTFCDFKVILDGFNLWLNDKQDTPWSNYIFEPELPDSSFFDKEDLEEYLKNNPDIKAEMKRLDKLRKDLEDEENNQTITPKMFSKG